MTLQDLEHAATSPTRFIGHLRKHRDALPFFSRKDIDVQAPVYEDLGYMGDVVRLYLVPGGRFLFTHQSSSVHLWDLQNPGHKHLPCLYPLASVELERAGRLALDPCPTKDGQEINVFTCLDDGSEGPQW